MQDDAGTARTTALLRELIGLTGRDGDEVLELQFGDVLTRTALHALDRQYLVVTALLPPCGDGGCPVPARMDDMEFLQDADEGRYVGLRLVPIGSLPDERSVLDAILATSDMAADWLAGRRPRA